jgi:hypothetical protein
MRPLSLVPVLLVCTACGVRVPLPPGLAVSLGAKVKVHVDAKVEVAVPIQGAAVVEFFGVPLDGAQDVVFVLDRSGSMDEAAPGDLAQVAVAGAPGQVPRKIDVAHEELIDALQRLPAGTRINVIFFNDELDALGPAMFPLEDGNRDAMIAYIGSTVASGSTALAPAMRTAFLMSAQRIVLLSDGLGNVGGSSSSLLRDAREAIRGGVRIDTIGLGNGQDAKLLSALADESGGIYQRL